MTDLLQATFADNALIVLKIDSVGQTFPQRGPIG
jgi:hypothetical protein